VFYDIWKALFAYARQPTLVDVAESINIEIESE